jgi:hypothetical protein
MNTIFKIVYIVLKKLSAATGLTYNEINIVVYYIIIPMIYFVMIDKIFKKHIFKIVFACVVATTVFLVDFKLFSDTLFAGSVRFLLWFKVIGWNYTVSSVIICVIVPILLFGVLFYFSYWPDLKNNFKKWFSKNEN